MIRSRTGSTLRSLSGSHQGVSGRSARHVRGQVVGGGRAGSGDLAQCPYGAVQALQHLGRHGVGELDDLGGAGVGAAGLALLLVGEGRGAQGEDLVDLQGVVERAGALRGDGRVVLQDDRGGEDHIGAAVLAGQHRPGVLVAAGRDGAAGPLRRVGHGHERARAQAEEEMGADQGVGQRRIAVGAGVVRLPAAGVLDGRGQPQRRVRAVEFARGEPYLALGPPRTRRTSRPTGCPSASCTCSVSSRAGRVNGTVTPSPASSETSATSVTRSSDALVPGDQYPVGQFEFRDGLEPAVRATGVGRFAAVRAETAARPRAGRRTRGSMRHSVRWKECSALLGAPVGRHEHAELPAEFVLGGGGAVRVEHIALEQHGVGHLAGGGEVVRRLVGQDAGRHGAVLSLTGRAAAPGKSRARGAGGSVPPAVASRDSTVACQEGRACRER